MVLGFIQEQGESQATKEIGTMISRMAMGGRNGRTEVSMLDSTRCRRRWE